MKRHSFHTSASLLPHPTWLLAFLSFVNKMTSFSTNQSDCWPSDSVPTSAITPSSQDLRASPSEPKKASNPHRMSLESISRTGSSLLDCYPLRNSSRPGSKCQHPCLFDWNAKPQAQQWCLKSWDGNWSRASDTQNDFEPERSARRAGSISITFVGSQTEIGHKHLTGTGQERIVREEIWTQWLSEAGPSLLYVCSTHLLKIIPNDNFFILGYII